MDSHTNSGLLHGAPRRPLRAAAALLLLPLLAGCTAAGYYWQGIRGQLDLLERARPIPAVVATTEDPALKRKLERVLAIREYASRELALPDNPSYRSYTDLGRRFVLWNVFAAPELSLEPRQWCFPVAGCVNYRGYFDEAAARAEAARLGATGDDVHVGGVPAFSTLGYFNDPMLSTVIRYPDTEVARLIFHELAHQVAYAKDDTVFNESFAVAVEEEGIGRWLAAQDDSALTAQFNTSQRYRDGFRKLISRTRSELVTLYSSPASVEEKRAGKAAAFTKMRAAYDALKNEWGGFAAYDGWFAQGPNNASLAAVGLYTQKVPEFHALLAGDSGDLRRFYAHVKALAALPKSERDSALAAAAAANRTAGTIPPRVQGAEPPG
jgi:predicted aminopeptidase